jgi:hypothetical protein
VGVAGGGAGAGTSASLVCLTLPSAPGLSTRMFKFRFSPPTAAWTTAPSSPGLRTRTLTFTFCAPAGSAGAASPPELSATGSASAGSGSSSCGATAGVPPSALAGATDAPGGVGCVRGAGGWGLGSECAGAGCGAGSSPAGSPPVSAGAGAAGGAATAPTGSGSGSGAYCIAPVLSTRLRAWASASSAGLSARAVCAGAVSRSAAQSATRDRTARALLDVTAHPSTQRAFLAISDAIQRIARYQQ